MGRELILERQLPWRGRLSRPDPKTRPTYAVLAILSDCYPPFKGRLFTCYSPVRHFTMGRSPILVRLACVRPAANVRSEPGSNSPVKPKTLKHRTSVMRRSGFSLLDRHDLSGDTSCLSHRREISLSSSTDYSVFRERRVVRTTEEINRSQRQGPGFYLFRRPSQLLFFESFSNRRQLALPGGFLSHRPPPSEVGGLLPRDPLSVNKKKTASLQRFQGAGFIVSFRCPQDDL